MYRDDPVVLIERQVPRLRRYARALVRDREQADDLVQDCLDQAWRRVHQWDPAQDLRVWLFSILRRLSTNGVRESRLSRSDPAAEGCRYPGALERGGAADRGAVQNGLAELAQDQHEILLLVCIEEMSYEQVAAVLEVPVGTVIARLHRAREHLRGWMSREQRPSLRRVK